MRKALLAISLLLLGSILGQVLMERAAWASRASSGSYSLPSGNPVASGTTISSNWANTTLSDIATELTSSLDRNGRGGMLAPLKLSNGTDSAPSLSWSSEGRSGPYRFGSGDIRWQMDGTTVLKWLTTGTAFPLLVSTQAGVTGTNSGANSPAFTGTGNGTGAAYTGTGGLTSGPGATLTGGTPNGSGLVSAGAGSGHGVAATGGPSSGIGVLGTAGSSGAPAIKGVGVDGGYGIEATSSATNVNVVNAVGYIGLSGGTSPSSSASFSNTITKDNVIKAAVRFVLNGTATPTIQAGFNITSVGATTTAGAIVFASAFTSSTTSICTGSAQSDDSTTDRVRFVGINPGGSGTNIGWALYQYNLSGGTWSHLNPSTSSGITIQIICTGPQ